MYTKTILRRFTVCAVSGAALLSAQSAGAAGFALLEQNASGLGNAYAGAAAVAEDASTIYFNAAGMSQLTKPSLVVSAAVVDLNSKFHDSGSVAGLGQALGGEGGNAGSTSVLPGLYAAVPINSWLSGGFGFNAPFGLKTEYDSDWMGRFQAIKSEVVTTNFNTALAFKISSAVSIGVGIDYQTIDAELTNAVNFTAAVRQASLGTVTVPDLMGTGTIKGNDSAWGFDAGVLVTPTPQTNIGLAYRSAIKYQLNGTASFTAPTSAPAALYIAGLRASALADGPIKLNIKMPASARLAATQQIGSRVELLGEVQWTEWSDIKELRVSRSDGTLLKNTPENWKNTWRYALGANFKLNAVKLRVGAARDQSPVTDGYRTARLPDNDRTWLTVGAQWQATPCLGLDLGYAHIWAKDASLNQSDGYSAIQGYPNGVLVGEQKSTINVLGAQATVKF